ncbi:MAG: hypothetical protein ACYC0V_04150 [Armatimonadota bacterium]
MDVVRLYAKRIYDKYEIEIYVFGCLTIIAIIISCIFTFFIGNSYGWQSPRIMEAWRNVFSTCGWIAFIIYILGTLETAPTNTWIGLALSGGVLLFLIAPGARFPGGPWSNMVQKGFVFTSAIGLIILASRYLENMENCERAQNKYKRTYNELLDTRARLRNLEARIHEMGVELPEDNND